MAKTGTKQSNRTKPYTDVVELESIIDAMGDAMRSAHMPYVANEEKFTPNIQDAWTRYVVFARNQCTRTEERYTRDVYR